MTVNSRYFQPYEFYCSCCNVEKMNDVFIQMLTQARGLAGVPFTITSGYRCAAHDDAIGGKDNSAHVFGMAADIFCNNSRNRCLIRTALIKVGFHRIGIGKDFIHVDIDGTKDREVIWLY